MGQSIKIHTEKDDSTLAGKGENDPGQMFNI